jgi:tetratricopeptide (TPR) repeat protein
MVVNYEDGSMRSVPFVGGLNTRDWTEDPNAPFLLETETQTAKAWVGKGEVFPHVAMWMSLWMNPQPEKKIVSIDFQHPNMTSVAIVCGLTLYCERDDIQDPRSPEELLKGATAARDGGKIDEAVKLAKALCRKAPRQTENWNLLGSLYMLAKDNAKALEAYKKSLDIQPNQPDVMTKVEDLRPKPGQVKP